MDVTFCPFSYNASISGLIKRFKYCDHPEYSNKLAQLLANEITVAGIEMPDHLIPVPMHPTRLRSRGYNQSALLCQQLAKILNLPYTADSVQKIINTPAQMTLKLRERRRNVRGSFRLNRPIKASHIAIIDDVLTTGATTSEISKLLRKNGAKTIQVWALAHTL